MKTNTTTCRVLGGYSLVGAALVLASGSFIGCSSGSSDGALASPVTAAFAPSTTVSAPNLARLRSSSVSGDTVTLELVISGQTASNDLYAFVFDLLLSDPAAAEYLPGTASFGTALVPGIEQGETVLVSQSNDRVVIGVSKTGGGPGSGNGVGASEEVIVRLSLRVLKPGATDILIVGSPDHPQNPTPDPAALDSLGAFVESVVFDEAPATITGI